MPLNCLTDGKDVHTDRDISYGAGQISLRIFGSVKPSIVAVNGSWLRRGRISTTKLVSETAWHVARGVWDPVTAGLIAQTSALFR